MRGLVVCLFALICGLPTLQSATILAVFPHTGKSHFFMFQPFVYRLAERGHQVTVVTHFPTDQHPPNLTYVSLAGSVEILYNSFPLSDVEVVGKLNLRALASIYRLSEMAYEACEGGMQHPNFKQLLKSQHQFDLVIVEFFNTDCFSALAHHYKAPLVGIFSSVMMPWHNDRFGNPDNPSYIPNHFLTHPSRMTYSQRVINTIYTFFSKAVYKFLSDRPTDRLVRQHFGDGVPPVSDIVRNSSLFLVNSHYSLFQPRPLVPGIVELGGIHVEPPVPGKLAAHVRNFLDSSRNGVVYFSLGSTVRGSSMGEEKKQMIIRALSRTPLDVVWKWEESMPDKPDNFLVDKWFSQNELLAHPKVKIFITHAGLMGMEEAVYHGVPMILMPLFGDQPVNAASCVEKGVGILADFFYLTEEDLYQAVMTILKDNSYSENAKRLAGIFKDRPLSTMDTALYWTEYVIRHKGARHLRSAAADLPWYSEYLLDVMALFLAVTVAAMWITKVVVRALWSRIRGQPKKTKLKKK